MACGYVECDLFSLRALLALPADLREQLMGALNQLDDDRIEDAIAPICEFAALLKEDLSTKEALRLFAEDELSTAKWLWDSCAALNAPKKESSASASM